jgi:hypothetical protein
VSAKGRAWRRALDSAPFAAVAVGGFAEKLHYKGVERALLEILFAALLLVVFERALRPRLGLARSPTATFTALGLAALGVLAVFFYPLPRLPGRALLGLELAALAGDLLAAHPSPALLRRASLACAALAVLFAVATHAVAAQGPAEYDPAIYLLNGRWLLEGVAPYRDCHLSKMPVILVPNALFALAKDTRFLPQAASLLAVLATGAILARSKALAGDPRRGLVFAVSVGLLSLEEYRQGGNYPETYATPFLALAWSRLMTEEPRRRDLVLGGCALALLGLTKQTHGLYSAVLLAAFALLERGRAGALGRTALVVGAALATTALAILPFAATGLLEPFFRSTVLYWAHMPPTIPGRGAFLPRFVGLCLPIAPLVLLAFAASARAAGAWARRGTPGRPLVGFLLLLATASALEAIEQRVFLNPHYMLHAFVPLALAPWVLGRTRPGPLARTLLVALAAWSLAPFVTEASRLPGALRAAREEREEAEAFARLVDRAPPDASAPLLVLGGRPHVYLASARRCADPNVFTMFLLAQEAAKGPDGAARARALLRTRPLVLVLVEPSNEAPLLDEHLPGWRAELRDLEPERLEEGNGVRVTVLRTR